jgi:4-hydroxybenzoate polyprenyltransferase
MLSQKIKALLATARIANVPSVVCNVITGMMMTVFLTRKHPQWDQPTIFAILAGVCLYIAGNFLNDWYDVAWDEKNRPERAIPSGLFSRGLYLGIAILLGIIGLGYVIAISKTVTAVYCLIALCVVLYTVLHKKHSYSIWIMGACRGGLYALGCAAMFSGKSYIEMRAAADTYFRVLITIWFFLPVMGLVCYIAGISLLARYETRSNELRKDAKVFASMLLLMPCVTHSCLMIYLSLEPIMSTDHVSWGKFVVAGIIPFLLYTLWVIFSKSSVSKKVGRLLAGISLVDSVYLFCLFISIYSSDHGLAGFLVVPLVSLTCFFSALLLQKIAPAT